MKKSTLLFGLAFLGMMGVSRAQDIGISSFVNLLTNDSIFPNITVNLTYVVTNFGSTSVSDADADSIRREILVNGVVVDRRGLNIGTLGPSTSTGAITTAYVLDWSTYGLSPGSVSVCCQTRFYKGGVLADVNTSNDAFCVTPLYSGNSNPFKFNFAIVNPIISNPPYPSGSTLPKGTLLLQVSFDLKNDGTKDVKAGIPFAVNVKMGSTNYGPFNGSSAALSTPGQVTYNIDALANGIFLPSNGGPFDLCIELVADPNDTDHSNDKSCASYTIPVGIDEVADVKKIQMFFNSNVLNVNMMEDASGIFNLNVVSVTGQSIMNRELNSNNDKSYAIQMGNLNAGMYIANVVSENGSIESYRFMVK